MVNLNRRWASVYKKFEELSEEVENFDEKIKDENLKETDKYRLLRKTVELRDSLSMLASKIRDIKILKRRYIIVITKDKKVLK